MHLIRGAPKHVDPALNTYYFMPESISTLGCKPDELQRLTDLHMRIHIQLRRYLTVGLFATITDFCLYGVLIRVAGLSPVTANLISRPCGGLVSFTGNKLWTFEKRGITGTRSQFLRFLTTWLGSYALSETLVWFFSQRVGLPPLLTKISAEAIACSGVFVAHRYWTFR